MDINKLFLKRTYTSYRTLRDILYRMIEPLDHLFMIINEKRELPPIYLRRHVGTLKDFETSGKEFVIYLRIFVGLKADSKFLDIGCGCGLIPLYLKDYMDSSGQYVGVDIYKPSIEWCQKHITKNYPNFKFIHIDIKNSVYNPKGKYSAETFKFPFEDRSFDVILLKSVFTHMLPNEVENYMGEINRLLKPNGRSLVTAFLLNEEQKKYAEKGLSRLAFNYGDDKYRYLRKGAPESAIAYDESYFISIIKKHNLSIREPILYGTWSGRKDGISFQDMIIIEKKVDHIPEE